MITDDDVYLRPISATDRTEYLDLTRCSKALHDPWISPPTSNHTFDLYVMRLARDDHVGLAVCSSANHVIVGVININNIVRGSFQSASLGYYVNVDYRGKGYMSKGLEKVKARAFTRLGLHRLEANIQPGNRPSIALVKRAGFQCEGLSPGYLYIDGAWRDHERWACINPRP
ncbi:MAG: GNAT family protein [Proteobacteria bacterium]|nr:GNAT family protein [Pseudomonadota bacterium]